MGCSQPNLMVSPVDHHGEVHPPQFAGRLSTDQPPEADRFRLYTTVPCGGCDACKLERSRQWAVRCMHEASLYEDNCFITLTYDDQHLPWAASLNKEHFQKFLKRLRKRYAPQTIRFYHCGEYGERHGRPHYHALLFGFAFPDRALLGERRGLPVWRSEALEQLWPYGRSEIGTLTFESAAYVARYILKKQVNTESPHELREPEYLTMSRRPGIGRDWIERYAGEVYPRDAVIAGGARIKPPRYYDVVVELSGAVDLLAIKQSRAERAAEKVPSTLQSRHASDVITRSKITLKKRELE